MSYLLDTNVVSELRKPAHKANASVRRWAAARRPSELYLSVVTVMEIEIGIGRLRRKDFDQGQRLQAWLEHNVLELFEDRILPIDLLVARQAARLHVPHPAPERDALIAATALVQGLTVVTRNVSDFDAMTAAVINPWQ